MQQVKPKLRNGIFSLLTSLILLGTLIQPHVFAESISQPNTPTDPQLDLEQTGRIEIPSLRTETSKVYENSERWQTSFVTP